MKSAHWKVASHKTWLDFRCEFAFFLLKVHFSCTWILLAQSLSGWPEHGHCRKLVVTCMLVWMVRSEYDSFDEFCKVNEWIKMVCLPNTIADKLKGNIYRVLAEWLVPWKPTRIVNVFKCFLSGHSFANAFFIFMHALTKWGSLCFAMRLTWNS